MGIHRWGPPANPGLWSTHNQPGASHRHTKTSVTSSTLHEMTGRGDQPSATRGHACPRPDEMANVQSAHITKDILRFPSGNPPIRAVRWPLVPAPLHRWGN